MYGKNFKTTTWIYYMSMHSSSWSSSSILSFVWSKSPFNTVGIKYLQLLCFNIVLRLCHFASLNRQPDMNFLAHFPVHFFLHADEDFFWCDSLFSSSCLRRISQLFHSFIGQNIYSLYHVTWGNVSYLNHYSSPPIIFTEFSISK